jgi:hypothetical protein
MPESFDGMLAELADAAGSATALPDLAAVRGRAGQRTVRRRLAVSALALTVLAACGGTVAAVSARHQSGTVGTLTGPAATGAVPGASAAASAAVPPTAGTAGPGGASAAGADKAFAAVSGLWESPKRQVLIIFPDGEIGMGEADTWALCEGRLKPGADGLTFAVVALPCGDYGTTDLVLRQGPGGGELTLTVPARGSVPAATVPFQRQGTLPAGFGPASGGTPGTESIDLKLLMGSWSGSGDGAKQSVIVAADGHVYFSEFDGLGTKSGFTGVITAYAEHAARVEVPCVKQATGLEYCQVLELQVDDRGLMTVVGGTGTESFKAGGAPAVYGSGDPSASPTASALGAVQTGGSG